MEKSGVSERCWTWAWVWARGRPPMKGLVVVLLLLLLLLGAPGGSLRKGLGEMRVRVSWERLREGTGGGGRREGALPESCAAREK